MQENSDIESILKETSPEEVDFNPQIVKPELCPLLWTDSHELKVEVLQKLLEIGKRFAKYIGADNPEDILFTGSLCNFNYHNGSDIDIHVLLDFSKYGDPDRMRDFYASKKFAFNKFREGTRIKGFPVECYAQDLPCREPHHPSGLYSLMQGQWIIKPERINPNIDETKVRKLLSVFINAIHRLEDIPDNQLRLEKAIELKNNLVLIRRKSVRALGEYSPGNLCFKELRKQGYLDSLFEIIQACMDRKLSLEHKYRLNTKLLTEREQLIRHIVRQEIQSLFG